MKSAAPGNTPQRKQIEVVGAVIFQDGRVFCTQRAHGALAGLWEFPGGKVEHGELPQDALVREIREELGCLVDPGQKVTTVTHAYPFGNVVLTTFLCTLQDGTPELTEHAACRWLLPDELLVVAWAPADMPTVRRIQQDFGTRTDRSET